MSRLQRDPGSWIPGPVHTTRLVKRPPDHSQQRPQQAVDTKHCIVTLIRIVYLVDRCVVGNTSESDKINTGELISTRQDYGMCQ